MVAKIEFVLEDFLNMGTKDGRFVFEAKEDVEWKGKKVKKFTLIPKISEKKLGNNKGKIVVINNPTIISESSLEENGKWWKCLDIGSYDSRNGENVYGYDDITFEELTWWRDRDKKKFLVGGGAIVAFFVAVVLVFRGIYQKKKKTDN